MTGSEVESPRRLAVHTREGVVYVPLSGDAQLNALLERLARRGRACVIVERVADDDLQKQSG